MRTGARLAVLASAAVLALVSVMGAGGFPSRPRFAAVGINTPAANPSQLAVVNDGALRPHVRLRGVAAGNANLAYVNFEDSSGAEIGYVGDDSGGDGSIGLRANTAAANIEITTGAGGAITGNSVDMTPSSGTFTAVFSDACTVDQSVTFDYQRIGNHVTLFIPVAPTSCTSDSTSYQTTAAPVPAALRPAAITVSALYGGFTSNSVSAQGCLRVSADGNLHFGILSGNNCNMASWTASGGKNAPASVVLSYMLGNP